LDVYGGGAKEKNSRVLFARAARSEPVINLNQETAGAQTRINNKSAINEISSGQCTSVLLAFLYPALRLDSFANVCSSSGSAIFVNRVERKYMYLNGRYKQKARA
jgi:hypothetical protein